MNPHGKAKLADTKNTNNMLDIGKVDVRVHEGIEARHVGRLPGLGHPHVLLLLLCGDVEAKG